MKIVVLNGSPKGDSSVTIHSVKYLQKKYPENDFNILQIAKWIKGIERNRATFDSIIDEIAAADGLLWVFPLYLLMVPARLKQFIELIYEHGAEAAFAGKYTAALSTSVHFYDHIAHRNIQGICDDLDMKFVASFSADMMDLIDEHESERLTQFGEYFLSAIQNQYPTSKRFHHLVGQDFVYQPGEGSRSIDAGGKKVLVVTDAQHGEDNLQQMVEGFVRRLRRILRWLVCAT